MVKAILIKHQTNIDNNGEYQTEALFSAELSQSEYKELMDNNGLVDMILNPTVEVNIPSNVMQEEETPTTSEQTPQEVPEELTPPHPPPGESVRDLIAKANKRKKKK